MGQVTCYRLRLQWDSSLDAIIDLDTGIALIDFASPEWVGVTDAERREAWENLKTKRERELG